MRRVRALIVGVLALTVPQAAAGQSSRGEAGSTEVRAQFAGALEARDLPSAVRLAELVLRSGSDGAALLDEVTYGLATVGAVREAAQFLLRAYPFAGDDSQAREQLVGRLFHLIHDADAMPVAAGGALEPLRTPLDTPQLRSLQGAFWAARDDCSAVVAVLGDASHEYAHDDLVRLGDCTRESSPAVAQAAYARAHGMQPGGPASRALAYHAHALGEFRTAVETWHGIGLDRLSPDDLRAAATSAIAAGNAAGAEIWLDTLRRQGGAPEGDASMAALLMDLGYLHLREHRSRAARTSFERAWSFGRDPSAAEQLVYVTQRLHDNAAARQYAKYAIDAGTSARRAAESRDARASADRLFGFRRLHEDLGRRVTVSLDGWSGPRRGTATGVSQPGHVFSSYTQLEVDYRLGRQTIRDGRTVSVFTRTIADGGAIGSPWPTDNATLGVGVRWKPLRGRVLYLAAEGQSGLENRDYRDVLVRASASLFNGGSHGDDWHPSGTGWFAQNLYLDAAHYVDAVRTGLTADYRASYHGKVTGSQTMEPYAHVQLNGLRAGAFARDVRGGLGIRWNLWYGASRYDAPAHKLSLGVEYQEAFDTYLADTRSVFFTLGSRW
jgi:bacteriophage N4 adsorption protein A